MCYQKKHHVVNWNSAAVRAELYLLVSVVVRVDVVVELLVFGVLLITQLAIEIGPQVFQSLCDSFLLLHLVLLRGKSRR